MVNELLASFILALVQGITEWLPVSSSGHLVVFEALLNYDVGLVFDVALHFGTLMAVFVYFGKDIVDIVREVFSFRWKTDNGRIGLLLIAATIPAALVGYFSFALFNEVFSSLIITAAGFGITGLILLIASFDFSRNKELKNFGYGNALIVGIAQAAALFPGVSRSGSTLAFGLLLGLKEKDAMKFSFLLSIPIIFGANIATIGNETLSPNLIWATLVSFVVGLIVLHTLYKYVLTSKKNLRWFALYALLLGLIITVFLVLS